MLRGLSKISLDIKGRLAIPGRYRDALEERCDGRLVITVNNSKERCLWMYPLDEWEPVERKVAALPDFEANHQRLKRLLIGYASDAEMDSNGRVLLPAPLREFALIEREICLIGQRNKFELWSEAQWLARQNQWLEEGLDMERVSVEMEQLAL